MKASHAICVLTWSPLPPLRLVLALLLSCAWSSAFAAATSPVVSDDYVVRAWYQSDGLPDEQVTRLNQDRAGYLWVATISGMARFDGAHFENYPLLPATDGPAVYTRLTASSDSVDLIAAPFFRPGLIALEDGAFRPWRPEMFGNHVITGLFAERDGAVWVARDDGTVVRLEGAQERTFSAEDGLPRARNRYFATDGSGQVWIASDGFVARHEGDELIPLEETFDGSELRIGSSATGGPWVVTRDRLLRIENDEVVEKARLPLLLGAFYVQALQEDRNGTLWIGTRSQGLHVLVGETLQQVPTSHEDVFALCEDRDGNLWVGTNGGGLNRVRRKPYRLYDKTAGLLDNFTHTVVEDREGNVWFGNRDGGVARVRDGLVDVIATRPGWPQIAAMSVFPQTGGGMGVTSRDGVFLFKADPRLTMHRLEEVLPGPAIRVSFAARNGDAWLALNSDRAGRLREGRLESFGRDEGMAGRPVRSFAEDAQGRILMGTGDGKLYRYAHDRFELISLAGITTGPIQTIRLEGDDIWLGTVEGGVVVLSDGKVMQLTARDGLPDSNVTQIIPDGHGYLWFGSRRGIFRVSRKEMIDCLEGRIPRVSPLVVGHDDGLKDITCLGIYQPGALRGRDGKLWFTTRRGVLAIDPTAQLKPPRPPLVTIEEVRADGRRLAIGRPLRVENLARKLEIRFGVLNLSAPERVLARYRLDDFDADWVIASPSRTATYPRLPPGNYRFRVMASSGDGATNELGDTIAFTVVPRWWQSGWFHTAALLAAAVAVAMAVRIWSHRRLRQRLEKLEREGAIERERTRIAQNIHDDLGASLTRISLLTQHARHENSAGAGYFDQIHRTARDITRAMDEIVWAVNPKFDDLENLAGYIGDFAAGFLSVAGIRCRLDVPEHLPSVALTSPTRHQLFLCCKEALNNVVKHANADEVTIAFAVKAPHLVITIVDNGRGNDVFAPAVALNGRANGHGKGGCTHASGNGLDNIRRRMAELGGSCTFQSVAGRGSSVTLTVAFAAAGN